MAKSSTPNVHVLYMNFLLCIMAEIENAEIHLQPLKSQIAKIKFQQQRNKILNLMELIFILPVIISCMYTTCHFSLFKIDKCT